MSQVTLPNGAEAGPTKAEVRSVLVGEPAPGPDDHAVEVGSRAGAVTVEGARHAGRATALERKPERAETTRQSLAADAGASVPDRVTDLTSRLVTRRAGAGAGA